MDFPESLEALRTEFKTAFINRTYHVYPDRHVEVTWTECVKNNYVALTVSANDFHAKLELHRTPQAKIIEQEALGELVARYLGFHQCWELQDPLCALIEIPSFVRQQFHGLHPDMAVESVSDISQRLFADIVLSEQRRKAVYLGLVSSVLFHNESAKNYLLGLVTLDQAHYGPPGLETISDAMEMSISNQDLTSLKMLMDQCGDNDCLQTAIFSCLKKTISTVRQKIKLWLVEEFLFSKQEDHDVISFLGEGFWETFTHLAFEAETLLPETERTLFQACVHFWELTAKRRARSRFVNRDAQYFERLATMQTLLSGSESQLPSAVQSKETEIQRNLNPFQIWERQRSEKRQRDV